MGGDKARAPVSGMHLCGAEHRSSLPLVLKLHTTPEVLSAFLSTSLPSGLHFCVCVSVSLLSVPLQLSPALCLALALSLIIFVFFFLFLSVIPFTPTSPTS